MNNGPSASPNALIAKDQFTVEYDALNCTSRSEKEAIGACHDVRSWPTHNISRYSLQTLRLVLRVVWS